MFEIKITSIKCTTYTILSGDRTVQFLLLIVPFIGFLHSLYEIQATKSRNDNDFVHDCQYFSSVAQYYTEIQGFFKTVRHVSQS